MNRPLLTLTVLLALTGCATPPALPAAAQQPTSPPPVPSAAAPRALMAPPVLWPPGIFRLHIESPLPVALTEHLGIVDTHYRVASVTVTENTRLACVSPCDAMIDARAGHAFTLDATEFPAPDAFRLPGEGGNLTLFVEPGSHAGLTGGRWLTALGALAFGYGAIALAYDLSDGPDRLTTANAEAAGLLVAGAVALTVGIRLAMTQQTRIRFANGPLSRVAAGAVSF